MARSNINFSPLLELLETIAVIIKEENDDGEYPLVALDDVISRGPPIEYNKKRLLRDIIKSKQRNSVLIDKIKSIKECINQNDEDNALLILASCLNETLNPSQKKNFITELSRERSSNCYCEVINSENTQNETSCSDGSQNIVLAPVVPHEDLLNNDVLDSLTINEDTSVNKTLKLPLISRYNDGELYVIHKGIHFIRTQMSKYWNGRDSTIIRELKYRNLLPVALSEQLPNEESYIMGLAKRYPRSYDEIKFILLEDRKSILESSIFVLMAQRNIRHLHEFLQNMMHVVEKGELSRACQQSEVNGVNVITILQQAHPPEIQTIARRIVELFGL